MRIALGVEYDGAAFCGWQTQDTGRTVQDCLEQALSGVADETVKTVCAGRTDTGVHATRQIVHFDTDAARTDRSWVLGSNANLPKDICVRWAKQVSDDFHARFGAQQRSYRYIIFNGMTRPALLRDRVCWEYHELNHAAMVLATQSLLGEHDFSAFRTVACQAKSAVRTVYHLDVSRDGDFIYIDVTANAFLHHMVRNLAGTLLAIGRGEQPAAWIEAVLASRDRRVAGVTAPAQGLYLVDVYYADRFQLPGAPALPRFG